MKKGYNKPDSEQIKALFKEYFENPTPELRDKLIEKNLYMAEILAKKICKSWNWLWWFIPSCKSWLNLRHR